MARLKSVLINYINSSKNNELEFNSEDEVISYINKNKSFSIENAEFKFLLNIARICNSIDSNLCKDIKITNSKMLQGVVFRDGQVLGDLYFWDNTCNRSDFTNLTIQGYSYFSNTVFCSEATFDYSKFKNDCFFWGAEFSKQVTFRDCLFGERIDYWCAEFFDIADFSNTDFIRDVDFRSCKFKKDVLFRNTQWGQAAVELLPSAHFGDNSFCEKLFFEGSNFNALLSISFAHYDLLNFDNCRFNKTLHIENIKFSFLSFVNAHFTDNLNIQQLILDKDVKIDFSKTLFEERVSIDCNRDNVYSTNIIFNNCIVSKNANVCIKSLVSNAESLCCEGMNILGVLAIYNSTISAIKMQNTSIFGSVILKSEIHNIDLSNSTSVGHIITNSHKCINPLNRETANILKHEKEKEGDMVLSLEYKKIEMRKYNYEMSQKPVLQKIMRLQELIIVKLNYVSNDYGQSWFRGILFILSISIITNVLLVLITYCGSDIYKSISLFTQEKFWHEVITFMWLPFTKIEDVTSYSLLYNLIYILGKILIAYGLFQTAVSFRKYSKG